MVGRSQAGFAFDEPVDIGSLRKTKVEGDLLQ